MWLKILYQTQVCGKKMFLTFKNHMYYYIIVSPQKTKLTYLAFTLISVYNNISYHILNKLFLINSSVLHCEYTFYDMSNESMAINHPQLMYILIKKNGKIDEYLQKIDFKFSSFKYYNFENPLEKLFIEHIDLVKNMFDK